MISGHISMAINSNSVSLAGEFAVLSQLALRGYDANMTLGRTKGVDILVSDPNSPRMLRLEVKTNHRTARVSRSKCFGTTVSSWMMSEKHESLRDPNLFYCFVNISDDTKQFRFFIVPSELVAEYVKAENKKWLSEDSNRRKTKMRTFRMGTTKEQYPLPTPAVEQYEDNWDFNS